MSRREKREGGRDYQSEYQNYQGTPAQRKRNNSRKRARRAAEKAGIVHEGDGKDLNHEDGNPMNNDPGNLSVQSKSANRSYPRTKSARKKNPKD